MTLSVSLEVPSPKSPIHEFVFVHVESAAAAAAAAAVAAAAAAAVVVEVNTWALFELEVLQCRKMLFNVVVETIIGFCLTFTSNH